MKKILFILAAIAAIIGMFAITFALVYFTLGLLGLLVDYLEVIMIAACVIVWAWLLKKLYQVATYCFGIAATLSWFDNLKKSVEQQQQ